MIAKQAKDGYLPEAFNPPILTPTDDKVGGTGVQVAVENMSTGTAGSGAGGRSIREPERTQLAQANWYGRLLLRSELSDDMLDEEHETPDGCRPGDHNNKKDN